MCECAFLAPKELTLPYITLTTDSPVPQEAAPLSEPVNKAPSPLLVECGNILSTLHNILVERGANYADIRDNSRVFDQIMSAMGVQFPAGWEAFHAHCLSNIATKLARLGTGSLAHEDNYLDIANYAILAAAAQRLLTRD